MPRVDLAMLYDAIASDTLSAVRTRQDEGRELEGRAGVGAAGVGADRGVDQAARGRALAADWPVPAGAIWASESFTITGLMDHLFD